MSGEVGQLKRWKVGSLHKTMAKQPEAIYRTQLLSGQISSPIKEKAESVTFRQWAQQYLDLEQVKKLKSYRMRRDHVRNLARFFNNTPLGAITPEDVRKYRQQRVGPKGRPLAI